MTPQLSRLAPRVCKPVVRQLTPKTGQRMISQTVMTSKGSAAKASMDLWHMFAHARPKITPAPSAGKPGTAIEFLSRLKAPSADAETQVKLAYQRVLMSLLAKRHPEAYMKVLKDNAVPRVENRSPETVFKTGSEFHPGGTTDVVTHAAGSGPSQLMGTSLDPQNLCIDGDYLYHITPSEGSGILVGQVLERYNLTRPRCQQIHWDEMEFAVARFQPPEQYKYCQEILGRSETNHIIKLGPKIENPEWENRNYNNLETDLDKLWDEATQSGFVS